LVIYFSLFFSYVESGGIIIRRHLNASGDRRVCQKKKNQILQASRKENVPVLVALNGADEAIRTTSTITREEDRRDSQASSNKSQKKQLLEQVAPI
jgi:hypothetical protein